jgi:hypothetical protein
MQFIKTTQMLPGSLSQGRPGTKTGLPTSLGYPVDRRESRLIARQTIDNRFELAFLIACGTLSLVLLIGAFL